MTSDEIVGALGGLPDAALGPLASADAVGRALAALGVVLPPLHCELLERANGVAAYGGYFRLFGFHRGASCDLQGWNAAETWKFAWADRVEGYLCFGETAWGDQYAYRLSDLRAGSDPDVYYLEGITMEPERIADGFSGFCESELLRNASEPYDEVTVAVRRRLGDLDPDEHILHQPSLLLGGEESAENVQKMPAAAAMIVNGDLATQLGGQPFSRRVEAVRPFPDPEGRMRIEVIWADS